MCLNCEKHGSKYLFIIIVVNLCNNLLKVSATIKLPSGSDYSLELDLAHSINVARCRYKVLKTKVDKLIRFNSCLTNTFLLRLK